jgi:hypothetical protein
VQGCLALQLSWPTCFHLYPLPRQRRSSNVPCCYKYLEACRIPARLHERSAETSASPSASPILLPHRKTALPASSPPAAAAASFCSASSSSFLSSLYLAHRSVLLMVGRVHGCTGFVWGVYGCTGVRCTGVWCMVYGVWCTVYGV